MARYRFELAQTTDDEQLRHVLAATPMDGNISVSFRCEPSYFGAAQVHGPNSQVVACREYESDQIVGFGCRSIRDRYVNGIAQPIGYLNSLRVLEGHRNFGLVARGYKFFRKLHAADQRTELYLTTIAHGNETAKRILTSCRAGLPEYHPAGSYYTLAIPLLRPKKRATSSEKVEIRSAKKDDLHAILAFLEREGPRRQFFPKYSAKNFFNSKATFKNLAPADILLAYEDKELVGTLAGWNQLDFRQFVVNGYQGTVHWARPLYNVWANCRGLPQLPSPGEPFRYITAAIPTIADDRPDVFDLLLDRLLESLADSDADYLLLGLHETDPLTAVAMCRKHTSYKTKLYLVCWPDGDKFRKRLDTRTPYLELGTL